MDERSLRALDALHQEHDALAPRIGQLMRSDPHMPIWTAMVIAQDLSTIDRARQMIREGKDPLSAVHICGSYARFQAAVELLPRKVLYEHIVDLWRGSDPKGSDADYLSVWKAAHASGLGRKRGSTTTYLRDGRGIPGSAYTVQVYRGQDPGPPSGLAWTRDLEVAVKFAKGAATRQGDRLGVVLHGIIPRKDILAYITGRNEDEVICDPADIRDLHTYATLRREPKKGA
jgi:hypothetical protein